MQKYGRTSVGAQRWHCLVCKKSSLRTRPDLTQVNRRVLFESWLTSTDALDKIADHHKVSLKTLQRWFTPFWSEPPPALPPVPDLTLEVLIIDAIYLSRRVNAALIGRTPARPVHYSFALRESYASWMEFGQGLCSHGAPFAVVLDGQRGGIAAVAILWPQARLQRCLAHVTRNVKNKLTRNPKTEAGQELRALTNALFKVWTPEDRDDWLLSFEDWEDQFRAVANEKTRAVNQNGRLVWWYTHKNLHGEYIHLKNALPNLFTSVDHPNIPRTTNHIEGGINARLKELLGRHRGISLTKKQTLVAIFLASKSTS